MFTLACSSGQGDSSAVARPQKKLMKTSGVVVRDAATTACRTIRHCAGCPRAAEERALARLAGVAVFGFAADSTREAPASRLYQKTASVQGTLAHHRQLVQRIFAADISQPVDFGLAEFCAERMQAGLPVALNELIKQPSVVRCMARPGTANTGRKHPGRN